VLSLKHKKISIKTICLYLLLLVLSWGLVSCGERADISSSQFKQPTASARLASKLTEVAPSPIIRQLRESLEKYQPQVTIISPQTDQLFSDTKINVQLKVQDLPIFKNEELQLGPHLHLILDNQPYLSIYDLEQPITLENLSPGTHTLRVFAVRPWEESFKNEGAYAQTSFHIFTKTQENNPDAKKPLLTYSQPQGNYGAGPIMLDFYLTNAPLHLVARDNPEDSINDWRIKVTINGESFILDEWKPVYLNGFQEGNNWVQLQFIDEQGNLLDNVFNDTVRVISYAPKGEDTLSRLVRGELPLEVAQAIVDSNYQIPSIKIEPIEPEISPAEAIVPETEEVSPEIITPTEIPAKTPVETSEKTIDVPSSQASPEKLRETPTPELPADDITGSSNSESSPEFVD
jgi:hypothetical protein